MAGIEQMPEARDGEPEQGALGRPLFAWDRGAMRLLPIVVLAIAWEVYARSGAVTLFQLPPLSTVLDRIWQDAIGGDLFINTGLTLYRAVGS